MDEQNPKLRILCLHGVNNTSEIFKYQLTNFMKSYEHIAEFDFLDGPFACWAKPIKQFVKMGFKGCKQVEKGQANISMNEKEFPPQPNGENFVQNLPKAVDFRYNCWFQWSNKLYESYTDEQGDKGTRPGLSRVDETVAGMEQGVKFLLEHLNSQEQSYDGFMCFSQGSMVVPALFNALQHKSSDHLKLKEGITLPYFIINFAGLLFTQLQYDFEGSTMGMSTYLYPGFLPPGLNVESIHFTSKRDGLHMFADEYMYFEKPQLIVHDQGHRAPKFLGTPKEMSDMKKFHHFITRQYRRKYNIPKQMNYECLQLRPNRNFLMQKQDKKVEVIQNTRVQATAARPKL